MTATAVVVTEIVAQSRTMREGTMKIQQSMMPHMMEHMQEGTASDGRLPDDDADRRDEALKPLRDDIGYRRAGFTK